MMFVRVGTAWNLDSSDGPALLDFYTWWRLLSYHSPTQRPEVAVVPHLGACMGGDVVYSRDRPLFAGIITVMQSDMRKDCDGRSGFALS